ncbi:hypothetical protein B0H66DRAFT_157313 [Apodospora peruviana]|uniref:Uncharacterized protein n=1 Tax=Apodospora peruviana TaxID=516989 RepID=A0AAE0MBH9_9PEZI|nr:hypothetical protein B0H66DRAFT_157313 [Apodospora peruviana]
MGSVRLSLKRSLLLSAFFGASLYSTVALAQNNGGDDTTTTERGTTTTGRQQSSVRTTQTRVTSTPTNTPIPTSTPSTSSVSFQPPTLGQTTTTSPTGALPTLSGLPTLSKTQYDTSVPNYPAPTIPPTNNAPFMNHSTLPDGTVFIAVGAILGAFGLAILAWRGILACLLHRSVERAAMAQHIATDKAATFPPPPAPFYKFLDRDSSPSLGPGGPAGNRKSHRGPTPSATPSQTNLFFSPTAAPAAGAAGATSHRDSRFLPSGFYAAAAPVAGGGVVQHGHNANSISLSNLRPASRGYVGGPQPSPPDSPNNGPVRQSRNISSSSINLNRPPSGRAPSAFLDDMLDDPATQGMFPPAGVMPPQRTDQPFGPATGYGQQHSQSHSQGHARY